MALIVTLDSERAGRDVAGDRYIRRGTLNLGNSYATGGIATAKADYDLWGSLVDLRIDSTAGIVCDWDKTNAKVLAFTPTKTLSGTYDPAALAATTARDDTVTVTGVAATDIVVGFQAAAAFTAGLVIDEVRVSALNTVTVRLNNPTAGSVDGASGTLTVYLAQANGAMYEVAAATDLSAVNFRFRAEGH